MVGSSPDTTPRRADKSELSSDDDSWDSLDEEFLTTLKADWSWVDMLEKAKARQEKKKTEKKKARWEKKDEKKKAKWEKFHSHPGRHTGRRRKKRRRHRS